MKKPLSKPVENPEPHSPKPDGSNRRNLEVVEDVYKRNGLWAAIVFATLGVVFLVFWLFNVIFLQKGRADVSDWVLLPVTILMFIAGLGGYIQIRRNRLIPGLWSVYLVVLIPPIMTALVIRNIIIITVAYLVVFALVSIVWVFPKAFRRAAIIAAAVSLLTILGIEIWNPSFRLNSTALTDFAPYAIALGGLGLLAFAIRQAIVGNIRTKLIISFVLISVIASWTVVFFVDRFSTATLTESIGNNISVVAAGQAIQVAQTLQNELDKLNVLALTNAVQEQSAAATTADTLSQAEIQQLDQQWKAADAANNNNDPLVSSILNNNLSVELRKYQTKYPENVEVFLTDLPGVSIASTDRTSDYLQSDEDWWQVAYSNGQYIGQPEFDASTKVLAINIAVAVRAPDSGQIVGILRTTVNINSLADVLRKGQFGQTGQTSIYMPDGREIALTRDVSGEYQLNVDKANIDIIALTRPGRNYVVTPINTVPSLASLGLVTPATTGNESVLIRSLGWYTVTHQDQPDALAPVAAQTRNNAILAVIITLLAILAALGLAQVLAGPIVQLTAVAEKVAAGDLRVQAKAESSDEIGALANAFNSMTSRLRELIGTLEQRVLDRTKALATSSEVSRRLSTILNRKELVTEVVTQLKEAFGYYHAQIYFFNDAKDQLVMAGGTGQAGEMMLAQFHKVAKGRGLVGRAAETNQAVLVSNTTQNPEWLANPLLPDTKSEVAIPISIGDDVLGVLDVQQNIVDGLQQEDVDSLRSIANQVAVALQNIQSTEVVAKRAAELQNVAVISTTAATISDVQKMLESVVHLTQRRFRLYHAHVFVYNENTERLDIVACGYKEGDEHEGTHGTASIPIEQEQSLVARAARTRQAVIVNDVRSDPGWLPNPLLPDTAAEMAVPMIVGDQILGVLDVQSEYINAFTDEDASIQTTLASQVATALQNARSFADAEQRAQRETRLNLITQKIQGATSIESALQIATREVGRALNSQASVQLKPIGGPEDHKAPVEEGAS